MAPSFWACLRLLILSVLMLPQNSPKLPAKFDQPPSGLPSQLGALAAQPNLGHPVVLAPSTLNIAIFGRQLSTSPSIAPWKQTLAIANHRIEPR